MVSIGYFIVFIGCVCFPVTNCLKASNFILSKDGNKIKIINGTSASKTNWLAEVSYKNDINGTGFAYIEVRTNSKYSNEKQAYYAGYLEGAVTSDIMYSQWFNTVDAFCKDPDGSCIEVFNFLKRNIKWVKNKIENNKNDPYWHHVKLVYVQLVGIMDGYNNHTKSKNLSWFDIFWLNFNTDISDLKEAFDKNKTTGDGHCSVLIKILPDNKDVYFGHNTWSDYQNMLRFQKKYIFPFRRSNADKTIIPGAETAFTGFPGAISSMDDFYLISSGLATTETTNEVYDRSLWKYLTPISVFENVRSVVANRLSNDGQTWTNTFKRYNSGTYNNQWMIFDYKKFKPGKQPAPGAFWVLEQIPSKIIAKDLTDVLIKKGYWSSYNIPYYQEIYNLTGYDKKYQQYGNWFSHEDAPRAQIFRRDHSMVHDMDSFMNLMRSNDYKNDPAAHCECNPPYSATGAIAARNDLNPANGTFQFKQQGLRSSGAIDAKITNSSLFLSLQFMAVSGPTTGTNNKLPPFNWDKSSFNKTPHLSHPNIWNFKPVLHQWKSNTTL